MKQTPHPRFAVTFRNGILCLFSTLGYLSGPAALAQRESFDASYERTLEPVVKHLSSSPAKTVPRTGLDASGAPKTVNATDVAVHFDNILFRLNSTAYKDTASEKQVARIAAILQSPKLQGRSFLVEGHTCDIGTDKHNLKLSAERAETVKSSLTKLGVKPQRLATLGLGESEPLKTTKTPGSAQELENVRSKNRRVVIRVLQADAKSH